MRGGLRGLTAGPVRWIVSRGWGSVVERLGLGGVDRGVEGARKELKSVKEKKMGFRGLSPVMWKVDILISFHRDHILARGGAEGDVLTTKLHYRNCKKNSAPWTIGVTGAYRQAALMSCLGVSYLASMSFCACLVCFYLSFISNLQFLLDPLACL